MAPAVAEFLRTNGWNQWPLGTDWRKRRPAQKNSLPFAVSYEKYEIWFSRILNGGRFTCVSWEDLVDPLCGRTLSIENDQTGPRVDLSLLSTRLLKKNPFVIFDQNKSCEYSYVVQVVRLMREILQPHPSLVLSSLDICPLFSFVRFHSNWSLVMIAHFLSVLKYDLCFIFIFKDFISFFGVSFFYIRERLLYLWTEFFNDVYF